MKNTITVADFAGTSTALSFNYNFDEVNKNLDIVEKMVAEIDPATADYSEVLEMEKKLKKLSKSIADTGKEAMAPAKAVIKEFEGNLRSVKKRIADIQKPLTEKHEAIDEARRQEKRVVAEKLIAEAVDKAGLIPKFAAQVTVKPEYLNLTGTKKAVVEDIQKTVDELKARQEAETKLLIEANAVIDTVNANITQKLVITDFKSEYDYACRQPVIDSAMLLDAIRVKAQKIADAEAEIARKAAEEAERKAKAEAEAEIAKKAAEEAARLTKEAEEAKQKEAATEKSAETVEEKPAPEVKSSPVAGKKLSFADFADDEEEIPDDDEIEKNQVSEVKDINTPETSIWEMVIGFPGGTKNHEKIREICEKNNVSLAIEMIQLRGSTEALKVVGEELKKLTLSYEVDKSRSRKIC